MTVPTPTAARPESPSAEHLERDRRGRTDAAMRRAGALARRRMTGPTPATDPPAAAGRQVAQVAVSAAAGTLNRPHGPAGGVGVFVAGFVGGRG